MRLSIHLSMFRRGVNPRDKYTIPFRSTQCSRIWCDKNAMPKSRCVHGRRFCHIEVYIRSSVHFLTNQRCWVEPTFPSMCVCVCLWVCVDVLVCFCCLPFGVCVCVCWCVLQLRKHLIETGFKAFGCECFLSLRLLSASRWHSGRFRVGRSIAGTAVVFDREKSPRVKLGGSQDPGSCGNHDVHWLPPSVGVTTWWQMFSQSHPRSPSRKSRVLETTKALRAWIVHQQGQVLMFHSSNLLLLKLGSSVLVRMCTHQSLLRLSTIQKIMNDGINQIVL